MIRTCFWFLAACTMALTVVAGPVAAIEGADPISTVAGTGTRGDIDDVGGTALGSQLIRPVVLAFDSSGNLHIGDGYRVRRVNADGTIVTVAGAHAGGEHDDGTALGSALLPAGLAFDEAGRALIADHARHRIRRVNADGTIETVAGTGTGGALDDAGNTAVGSQLTFPWGLAIDDAGNLYIADHGNHRVRRVNSDGTIVTVAGTGTSGALDDAHSTAVGSQLRSPTGLAFDNDGRLYIADSGNHRIRRMNIDGTIVTVAGTGVAGAVDDADITALGSQLKSPVALAVDDNGSVYVADLRNHRIRRITTDGAIATIAGTGVAGSTDDTHRTAFGSQLNEPYGLALNGDATLYIADSENHRVRRVAPDLTPPVVTIGTPANVVVKRTLVADFSCTDSGGSGLASCTATLNGEPISAGAKIDTTRPGEFLIRVTASDRAGNTTTIGLTIMVEDIISGRPASDQILRLYRAVLGRMPDVEGLSYWLNEYQSGKPLSHIGGMFATSAEFRSLYGENPTNAQLVDTLYTNVLGRLGEPSGRKFWINELDSGSRSSVQVVMAFADSQENIAGTATSEPLDAGQSQIFRLYRAVFGRAPDTQGFDYWTDLQRSGEPLSSIASKFTGSAEFKTRYGAQPSDQQLIDALYLNVLGRVGDRTGVDYWLSKRATGLSTVDLLLAFSESRENVSRTGTIP